MLGLWLNLRVQLLQKNIAGLNDRREELIADIAERSRAVSLRTDFAEIAPRSRDRGLDRARQDQIIALAFESTAESADETFANKMNTTLSHFSAAFARSTANGGARKGAGM